MKRGKLILGFFLITLMFVSFASAGFFDVFKNTGKVPSDTQDVSVYVAGAPTIDSPSAPSGLLYNPSDFFLQTSVLINVEVTDSDGATNLNDASLVVELTSPSSTTTRTSLDCSSAGDVGNTRTYSCTINLQNYDEAGDWDLYIYIEDAQTNSDEVTISGYLTYSLLKSMTSPIVPSSLSWPVLTQGQIDVASNNDPSIVINRGNYDGDISLTAYNLLGEDNSAEIIPSTAFAVSATSGQECVTGVSLSADGVVTNTLINSQPGPNDGSNEAEIYYCLDVPSPLSSQVYSTTSRGEAWVVAY